MSTTCGATSRVRSIACRCAVSPPCTDRIASVASIGRHDVRCVAYHRCMAKVIVQHVCSECGTTTGRWLGKCPGCGAFGSLVEELSGQATPAQRRGGVAARRPTGSPTSARRRRPGSAPGCPSSTASSAAGSCPPRSCSSGASRASASRRCCWPRSATSRAAGRRALLVTGEESVAQVKLRADRLGGAEQVEILAETELESVCATLEQERPDVCVIDSVQTLYSAELGSAPGSVGQVREAAGRLLRVAKEQGVATILVGHVTKDGSVAGPAGARASRRLRAPVRGRPLPRPSHPAGGEEPVRLDERARRVRDDRRRARRRPRPLRAVRAHAQRRGRRRRRLRARGNAADPARDPVARLAHRPRDAAPRGDGRRPEAARDDRRRALAPRRASRSARPTSSSTSPAACGSTSPAPTWRWRSRSRRPRAACPVRDGVAVFGEIGLTGRLRPAAQAERRLEECAKLGLGDGDRARGDGEPRRPAGDPRGDAAPGDRGRARLRPSAADGRGEASRASGVRTCGGGRRERLRRRRRRLAGVRSHAARCRRTAGAATTARPGAQPVRARADVRIRPERAANLS